MNLAFTELAYLKVVFTNELNHLQLDMNKRILLFTLAISLAFASHADWNKIMNSSRGSSNSRYPTRTPSNGNARYSQVGRYLDHAKVAILAKYILPRRLADDGRPIVTATYTRRTAYMDSTATIPLSAIESPTPTQTYTKTSGPTATYTKTFGPTATYTSF